MIVVRRSLGAKAPSEGGTEFGLRIAAAALIRFDSGGGSMLRTLSCLVIVLTLLSLQTPTSRAQSTIPGRAHGGQRIVGRVTDPAGRGVAGVFVSLLRDSEEPGAPRLRPVSVRLSSITNDRGDFVLENLSPDSYCVVALPHNVPVTAANQPNRAGYAITYYPNVTRAADAKSVMVTRTAGATANVNLVPARLSVVSGSVTASTGRPASGARLSIAHGDGLFGLDSMATTLRSDGTFALMGLPPGTYFLHMREGAWPPPHDVIPKVSVATVTVVDRDMTGVRVEPLPMVRATGRVIVADPAVRSSFQPAAVSVSGVPSDFEGNPGPTRPGAVRPDLTFEFHAWPAHGHIRVSPATEWTVARVRLDGVDVTNSGIDFRSGRDITGLEVELLHAPTVIRRARGR